VERVGRQDNFFELGGDSLTAMRLTMKTTGSFLIQIPVLSVFRFPSVQRMAEFINETRGIPAEFEEAIL